MACFKLHKESSSCEKKPIATLNDEPDSNPQSLIYVDPEDDEESVVPEEALERLGEFSNIILRYFWQNAVETGYKVEFCPRGI